MKLWSVDISLKAKLIILAPDEDIAAKVAETYAEDEIYDQEINCDSPVELPADAEISDYTDTNLIYRDSDKGIPLGEARQIAAQAAMEAAAHRLFLTRQRKLFPTEEQ